MGAPGFTGTLQRVARDMDVGDLRSALLAAAGLDERVEESRRVLVRRDGSEDALVPLAEATAPDAGPMLRAEDLTVMEFALAGLAAFSSDGWVAFAYTPAGTLGSYRAGDRLADGTIKGVESTDVTLETDEGLLTLPLEPLP